MISLNMQEIELKILNINKAEVIKKILGLGAQPLGTNLIIEKAYDFPDRRLGRRGRLLRLRSVGDVNELAYKYFHSKDKNFKVLEELQTEVKDLAQMEKILFELGFKSVKHREKRRTSFIKGSTHFEIDEYPVIPPYLEIEGSKADILAALDKLGYTVKDTTTKTATDVLKKYKVNSNYLLF